LEPCLQGEALQLAQRCPASSSFGYLWRLTDFACRKAPAKKALTRSAH